MSDNSGGTRTNKIKIKKTKLHLTLEVISFACILAMFLYPLVVWADIPDSIPMHYSAQGEINRFASKNSIFFLPVISLALYLLLTMVSFFPSIWNIQVTITRENEERVYRCIKTMLLLLKAEIMITFLYIEYHDIKVEPLPAGYLGVELITIFATLIFFIFRMVKVSKTISGKL
jgi:uncharacterized membrane protein